MHILKCIDSILVQKVSKEQEQEVTAEREGKTCKRRPFAGPAFSFHTVEHVLSGTGQKV